MSVIPCDDSIRFLRPYILIEGSVLGLSSDKFNKEFKNEEEHRSVQSSTILVFWLYIFSMITENVND